MAVAQLREYSVFTSILKGLKLICDFSANGKVILLQDTCTITFILFQVRPLRAIF